VKTTSVRALDTLALFGLALVLAVAFYYQLPLHEFPCPLCLLQRVGFIVAGIALMLNLTAGARPAHYGLLLLAAVAAGSASLRQIALHVAPGTGSYGSALWSFHFYTWAFVGYGALVVYAGAMLIVADFSESRSGAPAWPSKIACWLFTALIAANLLAALAECGFGACPDDPTGWLWSK
jgi:disulfide bond formation protein DsbB